MATTINTAPPLSAEYLAEFARAIGDAYIAIARGVGSADTMDSALWYLNFLRDLVTGGFPRFGVLADPTSVTAPFTVTTSTTDNRIVNVSGGQVGYQGQRVSLPAQQVSIYRPFAATYGSTNVYGVQLGLPLSEIQTASQINSTTVSVSANAGAANLAVTDLALATSLGFPLKAYIGTTFVVFGGLDSTGTMLRVDYGFNNGTLPVGFAATTQVVFLYTPRVLSICGLPVAQSYLTSLNASAFPYYPPMPKTWVPIAQLLVENPASPAVATVGGVPSILSTVQQWQGPVDSGGNPLFSVADAPTMLTAINQGIATLNSISDASSIGDLISALVSYTRVVANNPQISFSQFWAGQPFKVNSNFAVGVSFDSIERIEFTPSFAQAYFKQTGKDIEHTFALFRGDLYQTEGSAPLVGAPPASVSAHSVAAIGPISSLTEGTYFYGVSAIVPTGETPLSSYGVGKTQTDHSASFYVNEIAYGSVAQALGYHVYRRSTLVGDQTEWRLTPDGGLQGYGAFAATTWTPVAALTIGDALAAFPISTGSATYLGGVSFIASLAAMPSPSDTSGLSVSLYTKSGSAPGALIATGTAVPYASMTTSAQMVTSIFNMVLPTGQNSFYVVVGYTISPPGGNFILGGRTASPDGASLIESANSGTSWSAVGSVAEAWAQPRMYLDYGQAGQSLSQRGIRLTGVTALTSSRLSLYVPLLDRTLPSLPPVPLGGTNDDTRTQNDMVFTVSASLGASGIPVSLTATVPKNTIRGTRILLGSTTDLYDRVLDVTVVPGANLSLGSDNSIQWSPYDFVTVETVP